MIRFNGLSIAVAALDIPDKKRGKRVERFIHGETATADEFLISVFADKVHYVPGALLKLAILVCA